MNSDLTNGYNLSLQRVKTIERLSNDIGTYARGI